jgi:hypothetical protein
MIKSILDGMWSNRHNVGMIWLFVFAVMLVGEAPYTIVGMVFISGFWTIVTSFLFRLYNKLK